MEKTDFYALQDELQRSLETFLETFERYNAAAGTLIDNSEEIKRAALDTDEETIEALLRLLANTECTGTISYGIFRRYILNEGELYKKII